MFQARKMVLWLPLGKNRIEPNIIIHFPHDIMLQDGLLVLVLLRYFAQLLRCHYVQWHFQWLLASANVYDELFLPVMWTINCLLGIKLLFTRVLFTARQMSQILKFNILSRFFANSAEQTETLKV